MRRSLKESAETEAPNARVDSPSSAELAMGFGRLGGRDMCEVTEIERERSDLIDALDQDIPDEFWEQLAFIEEVDRQVTEIEQALNPTPPTIIDVTTS